MVNPRPGHGRKKDETVYIEIPGTGPRKQKPFSPLLNVSHFKKMSIVHAVRYPIGAKQGAKGNRSFYENPLPKQNRVIGEQGNSQKPDFPYLKWILVPY
jgi:hypothetical protein